MTEGSIGRQIIKFAVPLFLGNLFQQLYNTADTLIVGRLLGSGALAAVSSTGSLVFLLVGFFGGICMGAGVVISRFFGAKDDHSLELAIHTTLAFSLAAGVFLTVFGSIFAPQILIWMDTPEEVLAEATEYIRVYFAGCVGMVMYNGCMGVMQAVGDSRHPLYYLIVSSLMNVALDIVFIAAFHWGVGGAAIATIISQFFSVFLCMLRLTRVQENYRVSLWKIRFDAEMLKLIVRYGLPSGLQNSVIALANVVVQSNINYFGAMAMAGCGAYSRIEGFAFLPITCFTAAITTFVSQNLGAEEYERVKKGARFGVICSVAIAEAIGVITFAAAPAFIGLFTDAPEAIAFGVQKAQTCGLFYCLLAVSHCFSAVLRGAGRAMVPMATMLAYWCVVRVTLLTVLVPLTQSIAIVNWVYPITWSLSTVTLFIYYKKANWIYGFKAKNAER